MAVVFVNRRRVEEIRQEICIGRGKEGSCYLPSDDNKIVKLYHIWDAKRKLHFMNCEHPSIAFPKDILLDEETKMLVGYTMYFLGGMHFSNGFLDKLSLEELKKSYQQVKQLIMNYPNIYMNDNCLDNMLYDYRFRRINLIDTSRWYERENAFVENINELNWQLTTAILENIDWEHFPLKNNPGIKHNYELYLAFQKCFTQKQIANKSVVMIPNLFLEFLEELEVEVAKEKKEKVLRIKDLRLNS